MHNPILQCYSSEISSQMSNGLSCGPKTLRSLRSNPIPLCLLCGITLHNCAKWGLEMIRSIHWWMVNGNGALTEADSWHAAWSLVIHGMLPVRSFTFSVNCSDQSLCQFSSVNDETLGTIPTDFFNGEISWHCQWMMWVGINTKMNRTKMLKPRSHQD